MTVLNLPHPLSPFPQSLDYDNKDEKEDEADAADADYDNWVVKITGIPLREEIFEILEEVIDDLTPAT